MTEGTLSRLQDVFRAALELPAGADTAQLKQEDEAKWDSVAHVLLVSGMENEFGVTIDMDDSLRITSFDTARALLAEKGVA